MPDSGDGGDALELFAAWLSRREKGELVEFDALVRNHPQLASEFAELHATWKELAEAGDPDGPSLHQRLQSRFGAASIPDVSLRGRENDDADTDLSAALIAQLSSHRLRFGRYQIRGEVARGGMGAILKIWDEELRRTLAMKVVLGKDDSAASGSTPAIDARTLGRFLEEAQITGQLDHPGIVPVHELGLDSDGRVYFTMKLVKGEDLRRIFEHVLSGKDGWNQTRAVGALLKVCEALSYAHAKGVIHRDLKPANVMVGKYGEVYVMDWGLARVVGRQDRHDLRIQTESDANAAAPTARSEAHEDAHDSPVVTMDGDVVGTPAYMPPEQARGDRAALGTQSDVYAIGAMLYHLLAGQSPFVPPDSRLSARAVLMRVLAGPPTPLVELAPRAPTELIAICEKSMQREPALRYRDVVELADDLRAYLERRVVHAYETGTWAETRKWVQRNKPLAASVAAAMVILICGIVFSAKYAADAKWSAHRADEKTLEATRLKDAAVAQSRELRIRGLMQEFAEFEALDDTLEMARREQRPASEWWLERAHRLVDGVREDATKGTRWSPGLADAEVLLGRLRERALPLTEEERESDRNSYPRAAELAAIPEKLQWYARMLGLQSWPSEAEAQARLAQVFRPWNDADRVNTQAWNYVHPDNRISTHVPLETFGREIDALVLARRAVEIASEEQRPLFRDTLAWALLWTGHVDEPIGIEREVVAACETGGRLLTQRKPHLTQNLARLEVEVGRWRGPEREARIAEREALERRRTELEKEAAERRTWRFAESDDQWWHVQLSGIVRDLGRLKCQLATAERSVHGPEAAAAWSAAIESIAASGKYRGVKWPSGDHLAPQLGLLPIGPDPASGLWEFSHLDSGDVATRTADGTIELKPAMGLVFVLLPGGRVPVEVVPNGMEALQEEALTKIDLEPFFLSKYELTNEQWDRLDGWRPIAEWVGDPLLPVTGRTWIECKDALSRSVAWLWLPTEAQWEYACRAGTTTPWWTGERESTLHGAANVDFDTNLNRPNVLQRIGLLHANPFGIHDVYGNAWEWCRDAAGGRATIRQPGDGFLDEADAIARALRGGYSGTSATDARSSLTLPFRPGNRSEMLGLRPARGVTR